MKSIYLDYAATSPVPPDIKNKLFEGLEEFANPSSVHKLGVSSKKRIENFREKLSKIYRIDKRNILFTSSGSEANNLIIKSYDDNQSKLLISSIEHSSVMECAKLWKDRMIKIPFNNYELDLKFVEEKLKSEDISLISTMYLNNETGLFLPIEKIGKLIKKYSPDTVFHVDGVQAFGKVSIDLRKEFIDYLTFSAHKLGGLKGCGGLLSQRDIKKNLIPLIHGGGQEMGIRSGTENLLSIISLEETLNYWKINGERFKKNFLDLSERLNELLKEKDGFYKIWKKKTEFADWIFTFVIDGITTPEVIVRMLSDEGIYISSGSACNSNKVLQNRTLRELGEKNSGGMLRVSFGWGSELEDVEIFYDKLIKVVNRIKR